MEFEDLQAIWNAQSNAPVFSPEDGRLAVALYQQREHARRRLLFVDFLPTVLGSLMVLTIAVLFFVSFLYQGGLEAFFWDGVANLIAGTAALAVAVPAYIERKKHERTQTVFAPSLRQELERGIAQVEYETRLHRPARLIRLYAMVAIGGELIMWEGYRINEQPPQFVGLAAGLTMFCVWSTLTKGRKNVKEVLLPRKRALESMRAALDEEASLKT